MEEEKRNVNKEVKILTKRKKMEKIDRIRDGDTRAREIKSMENNRGTEA